MLKKWNVYVAREGRSQYIGEINESNEELARCAALSRYGISADEINARDAPPLDAAIYPDDDFEVSPGA